jgi:ABC-type transport system involved in cytochrome c biogenesis permease component
MSARTALIRHTLSVLWRGSRPWAFLFFVAAGFSGMAFLFGQTAEPDLLGKNAMLVRLLQAILAAGLLVVALQAADAFSGARERGTLEAFLLAPIRRSDLALANGIAALSLWFAMLAVAAPYAWVLSFDTKSFLDLMRILLGPGTLLAVSATALGLIISARSADNKRSIVATLAVLLVAFSPTLVPRLQLYALGETILRLDPASAVHSFADQVLVRNQSWQQAASWLYVPAIAALALTALAWATTRRLRLDPAVKA